MGEKPRNPNPESLNQTDNQKNKKPRHETQNQLFIVYLYSVIEPFCGFSFVVIEKVET